MDLEDKLLLQRQTARITELENWVAILVTMHGTRNGNGFTYKLCGDHATKARAQLECVMPAVSIEYDFPKDRHIINVL